MKASLLQQQQICPWGQLQSRRGMRWLQDGMRIIECLSLVSAYGIQCLLIVICLIHWQINGD